MKRFHVHVAVDDIVKSKRFYAAMFGMPPSVDKDDYAKWMLEDPRLNFAISSRGSQVGINHLGFQAENATELQSIHQRLQAADSAILAEEGANCCYAKSDKYWITDPSGIAWESFHTLDSIPTFNGRSDQAMAASSAPAACCASEASVEVPVATAKPIPTKGRCCG